ncbi:WecB/TagA/CpsF family glycosyltransferase [Phorcysia thermohydrogeniphila]|uniref:N-acetylglucosaminyldiphosphoundecaprenol N-acetyl-beta-D-mannosaminyltransferase n=1 Tax=Phorcysia thermohydrogeniphila TaxID=936138 RepID=A0A4R1G9W5_9BACT|nr:WecB/TagA/CpsF family glycosyltransferase [Phorcysia thermohydrogeniphila]TCK04458.1 N-acetylglucosaminyldiphosphoundecaprenol N-acetyl-beta-D-mannosaminyltransferase [Phorcysia thermohydrogeniphila]
MNLKKHRIYILGCPIDVLTLEETLTIIDKAIQEKKHIYHIAVNAAKLVRMKKDRELYESVVNADIINADGMAVVWASKLIGKPLPERVAGIDLMQEVVKLAYKRGYKIFFFGAEEDVVKKVVEKYSKEYSPEIIAGYRNGYYSDEEEATIAEQIANSRANILFVAMSSPKKEKFLYKYRDVLKNVNFIMGVGGSFDVIAGKVKRAPKWMQNAGLEWFYRFLQEPKRMWKRAFVDNSKFILLVAKEFIRIKLRKNKN